MLLRISTHVWTFTHRYALDSRTRVPRHAPIHPDLSHLRHLRPRLRWNNFSDTPKHCTLSNTKIRFVGLIGVNRILESGLESGKLEKYDLGFLIFRKMKVVEVRMVVAPAKTACCHSNPLSTKGFSPRI